MSSPHLGSIRPVRRRTRALACVLLAIISAAVAWGGLQLDLLTGLQLRASDAVHPRGAAPPEVLVVAIDETSMIDVGLPWPWPREVHAQLITALADAGAEVIAMDVLFAPEAAGDEELGTAIEKAGNVLLAETVRVGADGVRRGVVTADLVSEPSPRVAEHALGLAQVAVVADSYDGVVRRLPLLVDTDRSLLPALSVAAVAAAGDSSVGPPIVRRGGVQLGERAIPTDDDSMLTVSYAPELLDDRSPQVLSASAVLAGQFDPADIDGAVVFVGATDPTLGDRHLTPAAKQQGMAGVLLHANAYSTIATQAYLAPESTVATVAAVFLLTLLVALAIQFLRVPLAVAAVAALVVLFVAAAFVRADRGTVANFAFPALGLLAAVPASTAMRYALEVRQRRSVASLFSLYVPDQVAGTLLQSGLVEAAVVGQRLEISTMFCDLRGFTTISSEHEPQQVREMLDHYYEFASEIVLRNHGTLVLYVGDEVFAVWGAPMADPDHSQHATTCAAQLQQERHRLTKVLADHGLPELTYGIGVNSGPAVAAHAGSSVRRQYTVLGDTVNTGSRLCSQAGRNAVVISDAVAQELRDPQPMEDMGRLDMKGVRDDFVAWRLVLDGVEAEDR